MSLRPETLTIDDQTLIAELFHHRKIYDDTGEFIDILVFPTLVLTPENPHGDKFNLPIDEKMFTLELGKKFNGYTYGIGKIVRLSEINNDHLHNFIKEYFAKNDIEAFYERNKECAKVRDYKIAENLETLTFGNLKNIIRLIVKTDESFHGIEELNDNDKRKRFRQVYDNYVTDRDRFTHGKLYFLYPDFSAVLRIRGIDRKEYYVTYSKEIFLSNLETFHYLEGVLTKMKQVIDIKQVK